ncbi:hypothetical protein ABPG74_006221 [Tetrahymena malaccensis]
MSSASSNNSDNESEGSSQQNSSSQSGSSSQQSSSQSKSQASSRSSIPSQILKGLDFDSQTIRLSQIGRDVENIAKENNQFCNQLNRQVFFQSGYNFGQGVQYDRFGIKSLYQKQTNTIENKGNFNTYGKYRFEEAYKNQSSPNKSIIKQSINILDQTEQKFEDKKCPQCLDRSIQANLSRAPTTRSIQDSIQKKNSIEVGIPSIHIQENHSPVKSQINNKSQKAYDPNITNSSRFQVGKETQQIINNYYKQIQDKRKVMNNSKQQISNLYKHQIERNVYDEYEIKKSRAVSLYQDDNDKFSRQRSSTYYQNQNKSRIDSRSIDIAIKTLLNK